MTDLDRLDALAGAATPLSDSDIEYLSQRALDYHGGRMDGIAHGHIECKAVLSYLAAVRERDELRDRLREAARIIETADQRAMATDGPVGHARDHMHDNEWRRLYLLVSDPRDALHREAVR